VTASTLSKSARETWLSQDRSKRSYQLTSCETLAKRKAHTPYIPSPRLARLRTEGTFRAQLMGLCLKIETSPLVRGMRGARGERGVCALVKFLPRHCASMIRHKPQTQSQTPIASIFGSVISSMAYRTPSRPSPESLTPP